MMNKVFASSFLWAVLLKCPILLHKCSCRIQIRLKQMAQEGSNCCINVGGKVTTQSLSCTILKLESTLERKKTYKLLLYYVCRPVWGPVPQDMALTEQKPDLVVIYEPGQRSQKEFFWWNWQSPGTQPIFRQPWKGRQQRMKDWRNIWSRLALMHPTPLSRSYVKELSTWGMLQTLNISETRCGSGQLKS